jgi:hypothetical protein
MTLKMWSNNNVGLCIFVNGEKSNPKITSNFKRVKLFTSKNVGHGKCTIKWLILGRYNFHKIHKQVFINDPYGYGFNL